MSVWFDLSNKSNSYVEIYDIFKGFTGPLCNEKCPDGKHGKECKSECKCQNNGICDPQTGKCDCTPG